ncbi:hypothetical protein A0256_11715 [Mucilaginibacter sp. PAMC 26640]|nr:hypothetical protein A0256_11715 [Mucilaginibacter sp. PAMC 26640]
MSFSIVTDSGETLNIYLEHMNANFEETTVPAIYGIYRSDIANDTIFNHLSIPAGVGDDIPGLEEVNQKDYLGEINISNNQQGWEYEGDKLSITEQQQVAAYIKNTLAN